MRSPARVAAFGYHEVTDHPASSGFQRPGALPYTFPVALFDAHNRARAAGVALVYAARDIPDAIGFGLPDLRSRLGQCTRITLSPLDDEGRREVLRQRAQRRGLVMDDAALDWLLKRVGRDLGGLTALLDRLDRASLAAQRRITVPFLRQTLGAE